MLEVNMTQGKKYSVFEYLYRDASNYKVWGQLLLEGEMTIEQACYLQSRFDSEEFFIAEQIGVPPINKELWVYSGGITSDDHVWHSFQGVRPATAEDILTENVWGSVDSLLSNVKAVSSWCLSGWV